MEKLIKLCVRRPIGVLILTLFVVIIGLISLAMLKYDLYPNIQFPIIMTMTTYEGVGPEEIEKLVTRPLENAISAVPNVKKVTSTSSMGSSMIMAEFNYGTNMDFASLKTRERIDLIKRALPDGIENPVIFKYDPAMMPIIFLGISSKKGLVEATRIGNDKLKPRLERVPGVASVTITGGLVREFKVLLATDKLAYYKVAPSYIAQMLQSSNLNLPGGTIDAGRNELTIRTIGEFQSVAELQSLKVALPNGAVIPLQELAEIKDAYHDQTQLSRINGNESVMVMVMKESDANTVLVTRQVRQALEKFRAENRQVAVEKVFEQAEFIESSIKNVFENAIIGGLLAIIILYLFLRSIRSTAVISIAIPVSIIVTFALIYFSKMTLNLVSMGGLALGVGMLVDNAIVVLESIQRYREEGHPGPEAATKGAAEVGLAITASTLTTVVVFAPVLFVEDLTAQIFRELALTVSFSLMASLLVALTVIPMLASKILKLTPKQQTQLETRSAANGELRMGKVEKIYRAMLQWAVGHRWTVIGIAAFAFVLGLVPFMLGIKMEFMPSMGQKEYTVGFELPLGTNLETTNRAARKIEQILRQQPDVQTVFSFVGSSDSFSPANSGGESEKGSVYVMMNRQCKPTVEELMEDARKRLHGLPGVKVSIKMDDQGPTSGGAPVVINVEGPELGTLQQLASQIKEIVKKVPDTREVETSWESGKPELQLKINRERANAFGLTVNTIANTIQTSFKGSVASQIRLFGEEYDILVQLRPEDRKDQADLTKLYLFTPQGTPVQLSEVADFAPAKGPTKITRENQTRQVQISCQIIGRDLKKISDAIEQRIKANVVFPNNYSYSMGGSIKDMADSNQSLALAFLLAVLFVYMVIAVQYENLVHPLAIMGTLPLSLFGVTWSLYLTGHPFNVSSFIGVIMLAGIVVNNAIVLVDYIETLRSRGLSRNDAILKAGPIRLRPVLMTTLTTILGLLPMTFGYGDGGMLNASMATVVIGGLTFCTLLTLVVIPIVYSILDDFASWSKRKVFRQTSLEYHR